MKGCTPADLKKHLIKFLDDEVAVEDYIQNWASSGRLTYNKKNEKLYVPNPKFQSAGD